MRISDWSSDVCSSDLKKHGKPEAPRSDKYEVTSFGHRYLEEHKDELEQKPEPKSTGAAPTGVMHHVPKMQIGRASCRESVSVRVDLGGRGIINKKRTNRGTRTRSQNR